ncbi:neurophysin 2-like [Lycorma delicatula]|uniref:neurophysin 2-like n=1 Tax=Lycorma delicatula TaxID=130591 RepID=UPI003F50F890
MKNSLIFLYGMSLATACLITNCPKGGKRGFQSYLGKLVDSKLTEKDSPPQCIKCGPGGDGRCVGPTLCCGPRIGCLMSSPGILSQCSGYSFTPSSTTPTCLTSSGYGICAVDGICCNSESCRIEPSCEADLYFSFCTEDVAVNEGVRL